MYVSTELIIVSEFITTRLKAIELCYALLKKYGVITIPFLLDSFSPQIFSFLRDTDTGNPFVANKYTKKSNGFEWGWMMPYVIFFQKSMKNCWRQNKYNRKSGQKHNIWKQQHNSFLTTGYSPKSDKRFKKQSDSKVERQKSWRQQEVSVIPYRHPWHGNFSKLLRKV